VEEDCRDYEKVGVNLEVFRAFAEGFLSKTAKTMTDKEVETLALSCFVLTAELATRFLADYLDGDLYFNIKYPDHNLVRTRCQIALAKDMLKKMDEMEKTVHDCVAAAK
jgi:N-acetylhexosamine 1-kinase